ncbi:MAG: RtcB family protein [Fidelibacterota bacterium]
MDLTQLKQVSPYEWQIPPRGKMHVPGIIYASKDLISAMDEKVVEQVCNVACLPGIQLASYAMPDAHWGYGFPIGGVAAFDPQGGGVISAGGVGFDISCGVRTLHTGLTKDQLLPQQSTIAEALFRSIPAGVGSRGKLHLSPAAMDDMLAGGAEWALEQGYGIPEDLDYCEENGRMSGANPTAVSDYAKKRQEKEMGTLGSGNHYLEIQEVVELYDEPIADVLGIAIGDVKISIHCGSRGLGHQIGTDYLKKMVVEAPQYGLKLPERELASAPINSPTGQAYLGAMQAGMNCALANRQILTHLTRKVFSRVFPQAELSLLYDVSHNTCKKEEHLVDGIPKTLYVHRKGATRAFGPGHPALPPRYQPVGQPVLIGGTMGTASYILIGTETSAEKAWASSCHGAGRAMSRHKAKKQWRGDKITRELKQRGIVVRSPSFRGVAEEAPGAYKDVNAVVQAAHEAGLSKLVAKLVPLVVIKG